MDSNRGNQCNPNHAPTGPGHHTGKFIIHEFTSSHSRRWIYSDFFDLLLCLGYAGSGTKSDLGNHSNQMNPNNPTYASSRGGNKKWILFELRWSVCIDTLCKSLYNVY